MCHIYQARPVAEDGLQELPAPVSLCGAGVVYSAGLAAGTAPALTEPYFTSAG